MNEATYLFFFFDFLEIVKWEMQSIKKKFGKRINMLKGWMNND